MSVMEFARRRAEELGLLLVLWDPRASWSRKALLAEIHRLEAQDHERLARIQSLMLEKMRLEAKQPD